jgi:hypothetical protein
MICRKVPVDRHHITHCPYFRGNKGGIRYLWGGYARFPATRNYTKWY